MEMEVITGFISTVGFPIFVAVFMLTKGSKTTQELTKAVNELKTAIQVMSKGGKSNE